MFQIPKNRITYLIYGFLMVILTWLTFNNLATHEFENDDHAYLELLSSAQQDLSLLFDINRQVAMRPLVDLLAYISYLAWNDNPAPYHIFLVIMQLLASFLLAYTFYKLGANLETSLLGGLLFLMNVSHFRVVQWITCRSYVLTLIFGLVVLIFFFTYLKQNQQKYLLYASLFLILSIFTHPATFTFAFFCSYLAWRQHHAIRPALSCSWPLLILAPACVIVASAISLQSDQVSGISISFQPIEMLNYLLWYTSRLLTNAHWILASFKETPDRWELVVGFFICIGIIFLSFRKYYPEADWGIWILLNMLPFIYFPHMLPTGPSRHIYFSSVGSSFILASLIYRTASYIGLRNPSRGRAVFVFLILGLVSSSFIALKRSEAIAFYTTGRSYISIGKLPEGVLQLQKAYKHDTRIVPFDGYLRLAIISLAQGRPQNNFLKDGLRHLPEHPQLTLLLGISMYLDDDKIAQGQRLIQQAFEKTKDIDGLRSDAGLALQNLAGYYHDNKNYEKAVTFYKEALFYRPHYAKAKFNMAEALYAWERYEEAIDTMRQAVDLDPGYENAVQSLGTMLFGQERFSEAEEIYYHYLTLDNQDSNIYYNLALSQQKQGKFTEAAQTYYKALALAPDDMQIHLRLAEVLYESGNIASAIDAYQIILKNQPIHFKALQTVTALLIDQNRTTEAITLIQNALNRNSTNDEIWFLLAQAHQDQNNLIDVRKALYNAVKRAPQNKHYLTSYLNLGALFQQRQQPDIARSIYHDLIQISPALPDVHINLGILEFSQKRYNEAITGFQHATTYAPNDPETHLGLAQALEKVGKYQQAIQSYRQVLSLDSQNEIAHSRLQILQ